MNARDRLAVALAFFHGGVEGCIPAVHEQDADDILAADPHLAQDIEDGAALRRLREALSTMTYAAVFVYDDGLVNVVVKPIGSVIGDGVLLASEAGSTSATHQAIDKAREALS